MQHPTLTVLVRFKQSPAGPVQHVRTRNAAPKTLGPNSAGCHEETAGTLASVILSRCFQQIGLAPPALGALLSRSRLGHTCGCSPMGAHMDSEVKVQEGAVDMKSHTREHQAHFTVFSSSRAPQSRVLLPTGAPPPPKTNRHRHLHQDTRVAGLGCDFVPSHTRVSAPNGQSWPCHFVSALRLVLIFFISDMHYFHIKTWFLERLLLAKLHILKMGNVSPVSVLFGAQHAVGVLLCPCNMLQGVSVSRLSPSPR